jgi:Trk K+ transport system NAD-binding subunit
MPILSLGHGEVSLVEININPDQAGQSLAAFEKQGVPVAVIREGAALLPSAELKLQVGDFIILSLTTQSLKKEEV